MGKLKYCNIRCVFCWKFDLHLQEISQGFHKFDLFGWCACVSGAAASYGPACGSASGLRPWAGLTSPHCWSRQPPVAACKFRSLMLTSWVLTWVCSLLLEHCCSSSCYPLIRCVHHTSIWQSQNVLIPLSPMVQRYPKLCLSRGQPSFLSSLHRIEFN